MSTDADARQRGVSLRLSVPPQHGAWAFLAVPLLLGGILSGWSTDGLLFAAAWVASYPASYFLGRAATVRRRRGHWTRLARREAAAALPWAIMAMVLWAVLLPRHLWLLIAALVLAIVWLSSVRAAAAGRERGIGNDLLLVVEAAAAVPLLWAVSAGAAPPPQAWQAAAVCLVFFTGSVLHVKSLIRERDDRRWAIASRWYHVGALALAALSPWLLLPFGAAALRAFAVPAGSPPAVIGAVESAVSALVVVGGVLALG